MGRGTAQSGLPSPSFTHLIHLYSTQNDGPQSEAANRLVPRRHKGIRGFADTFGNDQIKARTFSRSPSQIALPLNAAGDRRWSQANNPTEIGSPDFTRSLGAFITSFIVIDRIWTTETTVRRRCAPFA
jgi:hypothetical protein